MSEEDVEIRSSFSLSSRPDQLMTVDCGVAISSPQILSVPLPAFFEEGSPWYMVA